MDMEVWLESLGITAEDMLPEAAPAMFSMRSRAAALDSEEDKEQEYLDVIIVAYPAEIFIEEVKKELRRMSEEIFERAAEENINARIHFVSFLGGSLTMQSGKPYAENNEEAIDIIGRHASVKFMLDEKSYRMVKALNTAANISDDFRDGSKRYCFVIDAGVSPLTETEMGAAPRLYENNTELCFTYGRGCTNVSEYLTLASGSGCEEIKIERIEKPDNTWETRLNFTDFVIDTMFGENLKILSAAGWKRIELDEPITEKYRSVAMAIENNNDLRDQIVGSKDYADTDEDGLLDLEEIYYDRNGKAVVKFDQNGKVILPTFKECMDLEDSLFYVESAFDRLEESTGQLFFEQFSEHRILPIKSDPTDPDGDKDGIGDFEEYIHKTNYGFNSLKEDTVIIKDSLIDDSNCIDNPYFEYMGKNIDGYIITEEISKGKYQGDNTQAVKKPALRFKRYCISTAVFKITPQKRGCYIISANKNVKIKVEEEYALEKYRLLDKQYFYDIDCNNSTETKVILEKDKTYRIALIDEVPSEIVKYNVTIQQDNWVYAPKGGIWKPNGVNMIPVSKIGKSDPIPDYVVHMTPDLVVQSILNINTDDYSIYYVKDGHDLDRLADKYADTEITKILDEIKEWLGIGGTLILVIDTLIGDITTVIEVVSGTITVIDVTEWVINKTAQLSAVNLKRALSEGNMYVSYYKYKGFMPNHFEPWYSAAYINRIQDGLVGNIDDEITYQQIQEICGLDASEQ